MLVFYDHVLVALLVFEHQSRLRVLDVQYFFDNDDAGFSKSEEKINEGFPVFLWRKLFEDIVDKKKTDDPYKLYHRIIKVKDINKLAELVPNPHFKLKLDNFFSKDKLDMKWIPKKAKGWKMDENVEYNRKFDNFKRL